MVQRLRNLIVNDQPRENNSVKKETKDDGPYSPEPIDLMIVRIMLTKGKRLPPGLVDSILDFGEYWIRSSNEIDFPVENGSSLTVAGQGPGEDKFLVSRFCWSVVWYLS